VLTEWMVLSRVPGWLVLRMQNDGFGGGNIVEGNLIWNTCRESGVRLSSSHPSNGSLLLPSSTAALHCLRNAVRQQLTVLAR
jgi:hypothetical protein